MGAFAYTLLHGTVGLDIDDISDTVGLQVRSESDHALFDKEVGQPYRSFVFWGQVLRLEYSSICWVGSSSLVPSGDACG